MKKTYKTEEEWQKELSDESFEVARLGGTERPFTGKYWDFKKRGSYKCICCGTVLFESDTKFDAGCGWPSLNALGFNVFINDPLINDPNFVDIKTILKCDLISLHVPFTETGKYKTHNLIDKNELALLSNKILINTSRGGIVNGGCSCSH